MTMNMLTLKYRYRWEASTCAFDSRLKSQLILLLNLFYYLVFGTISGDFYLYLQYF